MSDSIKLEVLRIPRSDRLDPIAVYFEDHDPGVGRVTIACYGDAWTAAWGQMGNRTVREFVADVNAGYLTGSLLQLCGGNGRHRKYTERIAAAVIAAAQQAPAGSLRQVPEGYVLVPREEQDALLAVVRESTYGSDLGREGRAKVALQNYTDGMANPAPPTSGDAGCYETS